MKHLLKRINSSPQEAILRFTSLFILFLFFIRALQELSSGNWDADADYLMYMPDQWLRGNPPWIREFDDKLPLTNTLFLLPALLSSIRIFQLESALLILLGAGAVSLVFRKLAYPHWTNSVFKARAFSLLVGSIFAYSLGTPEKARSTAAQLVSATQAR